MSEAGKVYEWGIIETLVCLMYRRDEAVELISVEVQNEIAQGHAGDAEHLLYWPQQWGFSLEVSLEEAERRLFRDCREGRIRAKGRRYKRAQYLEIPAEDWLRRRPEWVDREGLLNRPAGGYAIVEGDEFETGGPYFRTMWRDLIFPSSEVRAAWRTYDSFPVHNVEPLLPLSESEIDAWCRRSCWSLREALHVLSGSEPVKEGEFRPADHFCGAEVEARRDIQARVIGATMIHVGSRPENADTPLKWLQWAERLPAGVFTVDTRVSNALRGTPGQEIPFDWNITQCFAWIMYRSDTVIEHVTAAIREEWKQNKPGDAPSLHMGFDRLGYERLISREDAEAELFEACLRSEVQAMGRRIGSDGLEPIPAEDWRRRRGMWAGEGAQSGVDGGFIANIGPFPEPTAICDLAFQSRRIQQHWPDPTDAEREARQLAGNETDVPTDEPQRFLSVPHGGQPSEEVKPRNKGGRPRKELSPEEQGFLQEAQRLLDAGEFKVKEKAARKACGLDPARPAPPERDKMIKRLVARLRKADEN